MAAFFKYICRFENCQKKFNTLFDLINHIEYSHISRDPILLKQQELSQPPAVALSYVNCFFSDQFKNTPLDTDAELPSNFTVKKLGRSKIFDRSTKLNDSLESMLDESDTYSDAGSDDSCHSWSTSASTNAFHNPHNENTVPSSSNTFTNVTASITTESLQGKFTCLEDSEGKKRFLCTVPGCTKKYKNINGIKYHVKNGHNKKETLTGEVKKNYLCHCGKAYKSQSGLRHHQNTQHNANGGNNVGSTSNSSTTTTPVKNSFTSTFEGKKLDHNFRSQNNQSLPPVAEMCQAPNTALVPELAI
ncbi:juxtaposed with another zinc finger protein 1-like [Clytia hemisphaerica]|uniref:C2H2-type domain-containing protein n=1 Tax=Clytia hemisphaerica TaxID=252671 RepID=A0A7M5XJZ7_9CNID